MAFQFPSSPTLNQTYTYNSITWTYNGRGWSRSTFGTSSPVITVTPANVSDQANTSTGYFSIPKGSTAERPGVPSTGMVRYNSTLNIVEQYNGTEWAAVGGVVTPSAVSDQINSSTGYFDLPSGTTAQRPVTAYPGATRLNTTTNYLEVYNNGSWVNLIYVGIITATYTGTPTISSSNGFTTAIFNSSGTFTVTNAPAGAALELLVVAGGGGGGNTMGGGGGAGGLIYSSTFNPTINSAYTITIGAGGAGAPNRNVSGSSGSNTTAFGLTAVGGGGGGSWEAAGLVGGSGGGAPNAKGGGLGTTGQGNAGGSSPSATAGSGGGGAGAAATNTATGPGGAGSSVPNITGTYAGGGGGGAGNGSYGSFTTGLGGAGGGGRGGLVGSAGTAGTANTGGGGGGGSWDGGDYVGGTGGSGIVIVRYRSS